jgi:hypothetical protein
MKRYSEYSHSCVQLVKRARAVVEDTAIPLQRRDHGHRSSQSNTVVQASFFERLPALRLWSRSGPGQVKAMLSRVSQDHRVLP